MLNIGKNMMCVCRSVPFTDGGGDMPYDHRRPNCNLIRLFYASMAGHCQLFNRQLMEHVPTCEQCPDIYSQTLYDVILATAAAALDSITLIDEVLVRQRRYAEAATFVESDSLRERKAGNALGMIKYGLCNYLRINH